MRNQISRFIHPSERHGFFGGNQAVLHAPILQELDLKIRQPLHSTMGTMPRIEPVFHALILQELNLKIRIHLHHSTMGTEIKLVLHALILQELDLKIRPFWALLRHMQQPLHQAANINLAW